MASRFTFSETEISENQVSRSAPGIQFGVMSSTSTCSLLKKFKNCIVSSAATITLSAGTAASYYWLSTVSQNFHSILDQYIKNPECRNLTIIEDIRGNLEPCATLQLPLPSDPPYTCVSQLAKACGVSNEDVPILAALLLTVLTVRSLIALCRTCKANAHGDARLLNDGSFVDVDPIMEPFEEPFDQLDVVSPTENREETQGFTYQSRSPGHR